MREFDKPIGRVWRRMRFQRFLSALVWCLGGSLALAALAVGVEKLGYPLPGAAWWPFAVAGGVGVVLAAAIALVTGPSRVDAAVAIDRAFHLNERLSTVLTLPEDLRETPAGRALVADARKHVLDLDVAASFAPRLPRRAWVPLVPAALALALVFVPELAQRTARAKGSEVVETKLLVQQTRALSKSIAERRKALDKKEYGEVDRLLAEIEKAANELAKKPPAAKDKALVELNKLTDALKERQKQLGSAEQINRQLQQLQQTATSGPADELAKELAKGDIEKAANQLKQLQEKLAKGQLTEAEKKKLQEQLGEMKRQLEKLANMEQRRKQLEEARKNGGLTQKQFEDEMAKLDRQAQQMKQLQKLAQQMGQAQNAMNQGDMKKAANALGLGQKQLQEMAKQLNELEALDDALADLQDAKGGMNGDGMNQLGKGLDEMMGMGDGMNNGRPGTGLGRGRGRGDRPEAPDKTAAYSTKVKQQYTKGKAILEGFGPPSAQTKGDAQIEITETAEAAAFAADEALSNQKIPNSIRRHIKGYFDQIKEGK